MVDEPTMTTTMNGRIIINFSYKSFSLIELMVVIAIVAILASIAIFAYKDYVIRAGFAEILSLIEPYKLETVQAFSNTGSPPPSRLDSKNTQYVYQVELWQWGGVEFIHVYPQNFYPEWSSRGYHGDRIVFKGENINETVVWTCCIHPWYGFPAKYLPSNCQSICTGMN